MTPPPSTSAWHRFFHDRVGDRGCRFGGYLRIGFGLLFLADRLLLGLDLDEFFSPTMGILPMYVGRESRFILEDSMRSLLEMYPESDAFMWFLYGLGVLQGVLLVLGVAPRFQAACVFVNIVSFQNHNFLIWNAQDVLFRIWCIFLLFLPLHRITVYDLFARRRDSNSADKGKQQEKQQQEDSWPVWPFRLFQIQMTLVYMGLSLNKLECPEWRSGTAIYWIKESNYFVGGWIEPPEFLFNRMLPLQLLTWLVLGLELACWITMWIPKLKRPTAYCMIAANLFVDLTMNFHCLPWLLSLGWLATLFDESDGLQAGSHRSRVEPKDKPLSNGLLVFLTDALLVVLLFLICVDTLPLGSMEHLLFGSKESVLQAYQDSVYRAVEPVLCYLGLWQEVWNLFGGRKMPNYSRLRMSAILYRDTGHPMRPSITTEIWESPRMDEMSGWERKRHGRQMIYWLNLGNEDASKAWLSLMGHLAGQHQLDSRIKPTGWGEPGTVVGIELKAHWWSVDHPLAPRWNWDVPAAGEDNKSEMWTSVVKIRYCTDVLPFNKRPVSVLDHGEICSDGCMSNQQKTARFCRAQCEVCVDHYAEFGHEHLDYAMSEYSDWECDPADWDEECAYYLYYRDFDPSTPRNEVKDRMFYEKYLGHMYADDDDDDDEEDDEEEEEFPAQVEEAVADEGSDVVQEESAPPKKQIKLVQPEVFVVQHNDTGVAESANRRTILRSA